MAKNSRMTPASLNAALSGDVENFLVAATPGGIEAQEAREQSKAVAAQRLPKEGTILVDGGESPERRKMWESLGFVFGDAHDDLFVNVAFPAGWKLVATDHSMWSDLLDAGGRKRARMFYKGAFYDRMARINFVQRFSFGTDWEAKEPQPVVVRDCGKTIRVIGIERPTPWEEDRPLAEENDLHNDGLRGQAESWLDGNWPDWKNPLAYWD